MQLHDVTQHLPEHLRPTSSPDLDETLAKIAAGGRTATEVADELTRAIAKASSPPTSAGWTVRRLQLIASRPAKATDAVVAGLDVELGDQAPLGPWTSIRVHRFDQAVDQPLGVCRCNLPAMNRHHFEYLELYQTRGPRIEPTSIKLHDGRGGRPTSVEHLRAAIAELRDELGYGPLEYVDPAQVEGSPWSDDMLARLDCTCRDMTVTLALSALGHDLPGSITAGCELHLVWQRYARPKPVEATPA